MKILALADFHTASGEDFLVIQNTDADYDIAVFLGDIKTSYLLALKRALRDVPMLGVLGNDDGEETLRLAEIEDLNGKMVEINGVRIAGLRGSARYKEGDYPMWTQGECLQFMQRLPQADVLISHDSPYKLYGRKPTHIGLKGITKYLKKNRVRLNIHGHQHVNRVGKVRKTIVIGVYRAAIIDVGSGAVEQILL